ncbi:MAG: hypothetical protein DRG78_02410 [Epsilonproteobacteria bacterium]|nr:MAG: hypothetical protein DRG78_02410 [Campylobacterota bacterium]
MQTVMIVLIFVSLIVISIEDYKSMLVSSKNLSILFIFTNLYIYFSSTSLNLMDNFYFAYTVLGVVVGIELLGTTFMQDILGKYDEKYKDLVLLGEADYILIFTVSAVLNSFVLLLVTISLHTIFSYIYDRFINITDDSYTPMFPTTTLSLSVIFIMGDFIKGLLI